MKIVEQTKNIIVALWYDSNNLPQDESFFVHMILLMAVLVGTTSIIGLLFSKSKRISSLIWFITFFISSIAFSILTTLSLPPLFPFVIQTTYLGPIKVDIFHLGMFASMYLSVQYSIMSMIGYRSRELKNLQDKWHEQKRI